MISTNQRDSAAAMDNRLADLNHRFSNMAVENEQKLENIRNTMEKKITDLTSDNNKQLEQMRMTVDEKLQKTLEDRISQSFKLVSERLEQVYKGLGEMQTLASGVGDLKKSFPTSRPEVSWAKSSWAPYLSRYFHRSSMKKT